MQTSATGQRFTVLYALAMVAAAVGLAFVRLVWDPPLGASLQNLVSYGIVVLSVLLTLLWLATCSPFRWRTVIAVFVVVAALGTGVAASIREIEFDGDMALVVHYRWEPTAEQRLAAHRREAANAQGRALSMDVPDIAIEDMPGYRGHDRTGVIFGPELSQDWDSSPPKQLWKQPCGGGYSSFAVVGDFLVTLEQRGPNEAVVCYAAASGAERWVHEYPAAFFETMGGPGPRATPTIAGDRVFSLGAEGDLLALDLASGDLLWHVDVLPEGAVNAMWALASSPLVVDELVIVEAGGPEGDGLVACDQTNGNVVWQRPGVDRLTEPKASNHAGYSSPMLVTIDEVRQVLIFDGEGLRSHDPATGEQLWFHAFKNEQEINVAQPVLLDGNRIFLTQSYGVGCRMIRIVHDGSTWSTESLWSNLNMKCKFTSPVLHEGFLYGLDEGILVCLDPETGERRWKKGRYGHGQILLTNGQIVVCTEQGDVVLVDADPETFNEITRFSALPSPKVWNPHALSRGIVYVRNHEEMAAYDLRAE